MPSSRIRDAHSCARRPQVLDHVVRVGVGEPAHEAAGGFVLDVRPTATLPRRARPDSAGRRPGSIPSSPGQRGRVQRAAAAEGHQREAARIDAAADRHQADAFGHLHVDHPMDAERRLAHRRAERLGDLFLDRPHGEVRVEAQRAAGEVGRVQVAEHDRGVGDRRPPCRRGRSRRARAPRLPIAGRPAGRRRRRSRRCCRRRSRWS